MIEARPGDRHDAVPFPEEEGPKELSLDIAYFRKIAAGQLRHGNRNWMASGARPKDSALGRRLKGVAFLTTLGSMRESNMSWT